MFENLYGDKLIRDVYIGVLLDGLRTGNWKLGNVPSTHWNGHRYYVATIHADGSSCERSLVGQAAPSAVIATRIIRVMFPIGTFRTTVYRCANGFDAKILAHDINTGTDHTVMGIIYAPDGKEMMATWTKYGYFELGNDESPFNLAECS